MGSLRARSLRVIVLQGNCFRKQLTRRSDAQGDGDCDFRGAKVRVVRRSAHSALQLLHEWRAPSARVALWWRGLTLTGNAVRNTAGGQAVCALLLREG